MGRHDNFERRAREYEALLMAAELGGASECDLHEAVDTHDGVMMAEQFVDQQFMAGERVIKLVHGRGRGLMRRDVQNMLSDSDLVEYFRDSSRPEEMMAVTYAVLAERN